MRSYKINQPASGTTLKVVSSHTADTGGPTITIGKDGGATETLTLNGTSVGTGSVSFATIDTFRLSESCKGNITCTFTTGGAECFVVLGERHAGIGGDLGMALLGSGSHEAALAGDFEHVHGDTITKGGSAIDTNVMTMSISVANEIEATPVTRSLSKVLSEGARTITADATVFGETSSHSAIVDHLKATSGDIVWAMSGGNVTLDDAVLTSPGARQYEKGGATMQRGNTFTAQDLTITP